MSKGVKKILLGVTVIALVLFGIIIATKIKEKKTTGFLNETYINYSMEIIQPVADEYGISDIKNVKINDEITNDLLEIGMYSSTFEDLDDDSKIDFLNDINNLVVGKTIDFVITNTDSDETSSTMYHKKIGEVKMMLNEEEYYSVIQDDDGYLVLKLVNSESNFSKNLYAKETEYAKELKKQKETEEINRIKESKPFVGMDVKYISQTVLGSYSKTGKNTQNETISGKGITIKHDCTLYYWMEGSKCVFIARVQDDTGKVIDVSDHPKGSYFGNP